MIHVRSDWVMPNPPSPGFVPAYYLDGNEIWLHWIDPKTGDPHQTDGDIDWPFTAGFVHVSEFVKLGFSDAENYPIGD